MSITFGDIKQMLDDIYANKIKNVYEKVDGVALAVTYKNGELRVARNKGHYKNFGEQSLSYEGLAAKYSSETGSGNDVYRTFTHAVADLHTIFNLIDSNILSRLFENGKYFLHIEIVDAYNNSRVLQYTKSFMVLHHFTLYDETGNAVGTFYDKCEYLFNLIKKVPPRGLKYEINTAKPVSFDTKIVSRYRLKHFDLIDGIKREFNLTDQSTIEDYYINVWKEYLTKNGMSDVDEYTLEQLIHRWALGNKSFRLTNANLPDRMVLQRAKDIDKNSEVNFIIRNQLNGIFRKIGYDILANARGYYCNVVDVDATIKNAQMSYLNLTGSTDENSIHLKRLIDGFGGIEQIILPIEGIVIQRNGSTIKMTGYYPLINSILNIKKT